MIGDKTVKCKNKGFWELHGCVKHDWIRKDHIYNKGLEMLRRCMGDYGCVLNTEEVQYYLLCNNINIC